MNSLLDTEFQYIPAAKTNIEETLRKFGFQPPSETKEHQQKFEVYRSLGLRDLNGGEK